MLLSLHLLSPPHPPLPLLSPLPPLPPPRPRLLLRWTTGCSVHRWSFRHWENVSVCLLMLVQKTCWLYCETMASKCRCLLSSLIKEDAFILNEHFGRKRTRDLVLLFISAHKQLLNSFRLCRTKLPYVLPAGKPFGLEETLSRSSAFARDSLGFFTNAKSFARLKMVNWIIGIFCTNQTFKKLFKNSEKTGLYLLFIL